MKKLFSMVVIALISVAAFADWTYGTARFTGNQPSNCMTLGTVIVYYNGSIKNTQVFGGVEYWEGTGDICVIYPKDYSGKQLKFSSTGGAVQVQHLK